MTSDPSSDPRPSSSGESWGSGDPYGYGSPQPDPFATTSADADRADAVDPYRTATGDDGGSSEAYGTHDPYDAHGPYGVHDPYGAHDPYGSHDASGAGTQRPDDPGAHPYAAGQQPSGTSGTSPYDPGAQPYGAAGQHPSGAGALQPYTAPGHGTVYVTPPPTSGLALAGMILGISGLAVCLGVPSVIGLILSLVSLRETGNGERSGRGFAIAGIVTSAIGLLVMLAIVAFYVFMFVMVGTQS